jgi:hypothetical protein
MPKRGQIKASTAMLKAAFQAVAASKKVHL